MAVVEPFEVWSNTAERAWVRVAKLLRSKSSVSGVAKNDSATALSYASPRRPIDIAMPAWSAACSDPLNLVWLPRSEWWITLSGRRRVMAMSRASAVNSLDTGLTHQAGHPFAAHTYTLEGQLGVYAGRPIGAP